MYEKPNIPDDDLRAAVRDQYGIDAATLAFLPLGLDSMAGVYRVVSEQGKAYLLKAKVGPFYEAGYLVSRYLCDQGIAGVVAPLRTKRNPLWTRLGEWTVTVYPFIEGENGWNPGMTDAHWRAVERFSTICIRSGCRRKALRACAERRSIRQDTVVRWMPWKPGTSALWVEVRWSRRCVRAWLAHQSLIHRCEFAGNAGNAVFSGTPGRLCICHADLHPSNIMRAQSNQVFVIDWDDVMLAPKEHDFIFVGEAPRMAQCGQGAPRFLQAMEIERLIGWRLPTTSGSESFKTLFLMPRKCFAEMTWGRPAKLRALNGFAST